MQAHFSNFYCLVNEWQCFASSMMNVTFDSSIVTCLPCLIYGANRSLTQSNCACSLLTLGGRSRGYRGSFNGGRHTHDGAHAATVGGRSARSRELVAARRTGRRRAHQHERQWDWTFRVNSSQRKWWWRHGTQSGRFNFVEKRVQWPPIFHQCATQLQ